MNTDKKLLFLINYLLSERNEKIEIPENENDKFRLYRSLVNIRPAVRASDDFLQAEDEYWECPSKDITKNRRDQEGIHGLENEV